MWIFILNKMKLLSSVFLIGICFLLASCHDKMDMEGTWKVKTIKVLNEESLSEEDVNMMEHVLPLMHKGITWQFTNDGKFTKKEDILKRKGEFSGTYSFSGDTLNLIGDFGVSKKLLIYEHKYGYLRFETIDRGMNLLFEIEKE